MLEQISEAPQQQSLEIRQLITEEPILIYIDRCILTSDDKPKPSKPSILYKRLFLATKVSAGVIGLLGGIPWMNPSKNAAIIFPDGVFWNMFEIILSEQSNNVLI